MVFRGWRGKRTGSCLAALAVVALTAGCGRKDAGSTTELIRDAEPTSASSVRRASDPSPQEIKRKQQANMREIHREMAFEQFEYGRKEVAAKRYARAVDYFTNAVSAEPKEPVYWNDLGRTLYWMEKYTEARAALDRANLLSGQIHPQTAEERREAGQMRAQILCNLGDIDRAENKPEDALRNYNKAANFDPTYSRVHFELGNLAMRAQDYREAEIRFNSTLQLDPADMRAHLGLALVYHAVGNDEMAWKEVQTIESSGKLAVDTDLRSAILAGRDQQRANNRRRLVNTP